MGLSSETEATRAHSDIGNGRRAERSRRHPARAPACATSRRATGPRSPRSRGRDRSANQTQVTLPDQLPWKPWDADGPTGSMESAAVFGAIDNPGQYAILVRWHSDFMSASHTYVTDRPVLRHLRHLVGEFGREFRAGEYRAGAR